MFCLSHHNAIGPCYNSSWRDSVPYHQCQVNMHPITFMRSLPPDELIVHSRADSRFAPTQRGTALLCNVSHRLGANLESVLHSIDEVTHLTMLWILKASYIIVNIGAGLIPHLHITYINSLRAKFFRENKRVFAFYVIPPHWHAIDNWNPSSYKTRT